MDLPGHGERRLLARDRRVEQRHGGGAELAGLDGRRHFISRFKIESFVLIISV